MFFSPFLHNINHFYDFLLAFPEDRDLSKWVLHLKERICSFRSKFFPLRVEPHEKGGGYNENKVVASPENKLIHRNTDTCLELSICPCCSADYDGVW